jgi:predicted DNA binding CopG/RHH family protein
MKVVADRVEEDAEISELVTRLEEAADWEIASGTVTLRWGKQQIAVIKHAAAIMGVPYQTYLKQVVFKQALADIDRAQAALHRTIRSEGTSMAIAHYVPTAREMGRNFAEALGREPVQGLWVRATRNRVELWVLTRPVDLATERRLHGATRLLIERFPKANFRLHVINPRHGSEAEDPLAAIPPDSERVDLPTE